MDTSTRVLLIDDDEALLRSLSRPLIDHGFDVVTALCAAEARMRLSHSSFDVVICDYYMPGLGGLEFLQELLTQDPELLTFLLSGWVAGVRVAEDWAREIGVCRVFAKPCDYAEIISTIEQAMQTKRTCGTVTT